MDPEVANESTKSFDDEVVPVGGEMSPSGAMSATKSCPMGSETIPSESGEISVQHECDDQIASNVFEASAIHCANQPVGEPSSDSVDIAVESDTGVVNLSPEDASSDKDRILVESDLGCIIQSTEESHSDPGIVLAETEPADEVDRVGSKQPVIESENHRSTMILESGEAGSDHGENPSSNSIEQSSPEVDAIGTDWVNADLLIGDPQRQSSADESAELLDTAPPGLELTLPPTDSDVPNSVADAVPSEPLPSEEPVEPTYSVYVEEENLRPQQVKPETVNLDDMKYSLDVLEKSLLPKLVSGRDTAETELMVKLCCVTDVNRDLIEQVAKRSLRVQELYREFTDLKQSYIQHCKNASPERPAWVSIRNTATYGESPAAGSSGWTREGVSNTSSSSWSQYQAAPVKEAACSWDRIGTSSSKKNYYENTNGWSGSNDWTNAEKTKSSATGYGLSKKDESWSADSWSKPAAVAVKAESDWSSDWSSHQPKTLASDHRALAENSHEREEVAEEDPFKPKWASSSAVSNSKKRWDDNAAAAWGDADKPAWSSWKKEKDSSTQKDVDAPAWSTWDEASSGSARQEESRWSKKNVGADTPAWNTWNKDSDAVETTGWSSAKAKPSVDDDEDVDTSHITKRVGNRIIVLPAPPHGVTTPKRIAPQLHADESGWKSSYGNAGSFA